MLYVENLKLLSEFGISAEVYGIRIKAQVFGEQEY